jgi:hypothetical protein
MNYTETFEQFSSRLTSTDLALYAGAGLILFILFKDRLSPVQELVNSLLNKVKLISNKNSTVSLPVVLTETTVNKDDIFFSLVSSWKQTRDLAVKCGCDEAVKAADQMFPYLSPVVCSKKDTIK